ncbi:MAG: hypothetical protein LBU66_03315 [Treponema sp.]|jgi:hypothetical protein|nr:hypothetical protein [Treponema sp.]
MKKTLMFRGLIALTIAVCLIMTGCLIKGEDGDDLASLMGDDFPSFADDVWAAIGLKANKLVITNIMNIQMSSGPDYHLPKIIEVLNTTQPTGPNGYHTFLVGLYPAGSLSVPVTETFLLNSLIAVGDYFEGQMKYRNPDNTVGTTLTVSLFDVKTGLPFDNKKGTFDIAFIFDDDNTDNDLFKYVPYRSITSETTTIGYVSFHSNTINILP